VISLSVMVVFLVLSGVLFYLLRTEIAYFFAGSAPATHFEPVPDQPVPPDAPSNAYVEVRVDYKNLCDFWEPTPENPFPPDVSYAFTLQMGFGRRYFLTCLGNGEVRPRLWILRPESEADTKRIHVDAMRRRLAGTMLEAYADERVPEVHIPGGPGCVNDLCRGRLIRFGDYASNPLRSAGRIQDVLAARLELEFRQTGRLPLEDGDFLLFLGETPGSNWWYVAMVGGVLLLSVVNVVLGVRFLRRYLRARRIVAEHVRRVRVLSGSPKPDS
jgi:hypothetical protein